MSIRQLKMGKISDKMRQASPKRRKMKDVSSVLGPFWEATTPSGLPTGRRARALGRGWGGVNPPQGLEEIGLEWYEVAQGSYLHALRPKASADLIIGTFCLA